MYLRLRVDCFIASLVELQVTGGLVHNALEELDVGEEQRRVEAHHSNSRHLHRRVVLTDITVLLRLRQPTNTVRLRPRRAAKASI
jgi:hypothetical protein